MIVYMSFCVVILTFHHKLSTSWWGYKTHILPSGFSGIFHYSFSVCGSDTWCHKQVWLLRRFVGMFVWYHSMPCPQKAMILSIGKLQLSGWVIKYECYVIEIILPMASAARKQLISYKIWYENNWMSEGTF